VNKSQIQKSLEMSEAKNVKILNSQFDAFLNKLEKIEMPISFNSNYEYNLKLNYLKDDSYFNKIQKEYIGFGVFGILFETNNFIALLGNIPTDIGSPIILTLDYNGNIIERHLVYENAMGDIGIYIENSETIFPNRNIVFIDSTTTRKLNADGTNEIPGTDSLSVHIKKYIINDNGKFIRTE